jgi:hypothetical protein
MSHCQAWQFLGAFVSGAPPTAATDKDDSKRARLCCEPEAKRKHDKIDHVFTVRFQGVTPKIDQLIKK